MIRKRAILVNYLTNKPVDPNYQPLLSADELSEGNANLEKAMLIWRLRWLNRVTTLTGAVIMKETSDNAQLQFSSSVCSV
tara:strand:+ start:385 stop:624 length:240 start_codon:yes stop_codon:yes gene_type:complete